MLGERGPADMHGSFRVRYRHMACMQKTYSIVGPNILGPNPNPLAMLNTFEMRLRDGCLGWRVMVLPACALWGNMMLCLQRDIHALRVTCIAQ